MEEKMLFRVAKSFFLTGLGVLILPENPVPELQPFALHTSWRLTLAQPDGARRAALASLEELTRPHEPATRVLLLTQENAEPVPAGTEVWWTGREATWDELC
jgi:hypothetical protein